jgi:CO/xanthine dehydrogenase FAD-binding subunit
MDLNTITEIIQPSRDGGFVDWREGDAWLAGGTWLFSEPQAELRRLIDLQRLGWEPLTIGAGGLQIAATCRIAELYGLDPPPEWIAAPLIRQCCRSFLSSFKIWNTATVGGNICMSLPAGPMISLTTALEGVCVVRRRDGSEHRVAVESFVTGNHKNVLQPGDLLTGIDVPTAALGKRTAFRRMTLTHLGRSTALVIGTLSPTDGVFMLTVSAATDRPHRLSFPGVPDAQALLARLEREIPEYFEDVHGAADYRRHLTHHFAEEIRRELGGK